MTFTKDDMAECLHSELGLNKREAREFIDRFFETIRATLAHGESVKLARFGSFILRHKKERPGRNPHTHEFVPVSARRVVIFRASRKLRARIEDNTDVCMQHSQERLNANAGSH